MQNCEFFQYSLLNSIQNGNLWQKCSSFPNHSFWQETAKKRLNFPTLLTWKGVIHKSRGQILGYFWPLHPSWYTIPTKYSRQMYFRIWITTSVYTYVILSKSWRGRQAPKSAFAFRICNFEYVLPQWLSFQELSYSLWNVWDKLMLYLQ